MIDRRHSLQILIIALFTLIAGTASAYSGYVKGNWGFWQRSGNWCDPSLQNCQASQYLRAQYDNVQPFRNGLVRIIQGSSIIGEGSSNDNGDFNIYWNSSNITTTAQVQLLARHSQGRFWINNTAGQLLNNVTGSFTLTNGTTQANPQNNGSWYCGSSASPTWYLQVYWQAEMQWRSSFALVGTLVNNYTGIEVRGVAATINGFLGTCNTSCANGEQKRIQIDSDNSARSPQARMMHEAGHVASYQVAARHQVVNYFWPNTSGAAADNVWSYTSPEWAATGFEEAFATMMADTTLWNPDAVEPTSCLSSQRCAVVDNNRIEKTSYPYATNNCVANEGRWPMSGMRYLWDIYDDHNDCDGDTIKEGWDCYNCLYENMLNYPAGVGDHQLEEPWSSTAYTTVDDNDGRGMTDYNYRYATDYGKAVGTLHIDNCWPN